MVQFTNIKDRDDLNQKLGLLTKDTRPAWGKLQAQNMIEHLIEAVQQTNGKKTAILEFAPEQAIGMKQFMVYSDFEIPKNQKGHLSDASLSTKHPDLNSAIVQLNKELDAFEDYFKDNPTAMHAAFGDMSYEEWARWHGKHFTHHFKQFGLIDQD